MNYGTDLQPSNSNQFLDKQVFSKFLNHSLNKYRYAVIVNNWGEGWVEAIEDMTGLTAIPQAEGKIVYPITAKPQATGKSDAQNLGVGLLPHTEWSHKLHPPKCIALRCLTPDTDKGGATTIADFHEFLTQFTLEEQKYLTHKPQYFMSKNNKDSTFAPIYDLNSGIVRFTYNGLTRRNPSPFFAQPPVADGDPFLLKLCDKIVQLFERYCIPIHLEREQILIIRNYDLLHSRQPYSNPDRYLERILLADTK